MFRHMVHCSINSSRRRNLSNTTPPPESFQDTRANADNVWQEIKNRQGRLYYVNKATGVRSWEHPGESATIIKLPRVKMPEMKNVSERVYHLLVNSTNAYYGLFVIFCAGLTYRIMNPPKPDAPTIGPVSGTT